MRRKPRPSGTGPRSGAGSAGEEYDGRPAEVSSGLAVEEGRCPYYVAEVIGEPTEEERLAVRERFGSAVLTRFEVGSELSECLGVDRVLLGLTFSVRRPTDVFLGPRWAELVAQFREGLPSRRSFLVLAHWPDSQRSTACSANVAMSSASDARSTAREASVR